MERGKGGIIKTIPPASLEITQYQRGVAFLLEMYRDGEIDTLHFLESVLALSRRCAEDAAESLGLK